MNKAITDGLDLTPPPFANGLSVWSREDGTPGSATYAGAGDAAFVPADQDFGGALEVNKTEAVQRLRYTGETPILPGCYLRVCARVKVLSGAMPSVRIAGWAGGVGGVAVMGLATTGPTTELTEYGEIVEVSAIVGTGVRNGVDMVWGAEPLYGHFGLDLTGPTGGVVRIDGIEIEDITGAFLRNMMDWVDVQDFGAKGDGVADDADAFDAADQAAGGRQVLVPEGLYKLGRNVTMESEVRFAGTVVMDDDNRLILRRNFDLNGYIDAFGDEVLAFKKAFQALLHFSDHESLDLSGRRIEVSAPIDMAAAAGLSTYEIRRVIRNGQFNCVSSPEWDDEVVTSQAAYAASQPTTLSAVANVANVPIGAHVTGDGVGREVYVTAKNVGAGTVELSQPLYGAANSQTYTFTRYKYALDFSGFSKFSRLNFDDIDFQMNGFASGVLLAPAGNLMQFRDCWFTKPKDRGISSHGLGCQDLHIDRCHWFSNEQSLPATDRKSIGFNVNANDTKIRDSRFQRLGTTMVLNGDGHLIVGNHWFQGDEVSNGTRVAGLVLTQTNVRSVITGNYIDNTFIEWTNEHDATPDFQSEFSFGGLTITGNIFTCIDVAAWFSFIVIKPFGSGHFLHGMSVTGNTFRSISGSIDRVDRLDDSLAGLAFGSSRNVEFSANTFNNIAQNTINPVTLSHDQEGAATNWTLDTEGYLPFGGRSRTVSGVTVQGALTRSDGSGIFAMPYVTPEFGSGQDQVRLTWPEAVKGSVLVTTRMDNPI